MFVKRINVCLLSTQSTADKSQIVVELGPCVGNLPFVNFFLREQNWGREKKKSVLLYPIAFEELGREQFTPDYLTSDKLAAPELLGSQALELSAAPLASFTSAQGPCFLHCQAWL